MSARPLEAIGEGALVEEQLGPGARRAVAAQGAQLHVEEASGTAALVRWAAVRRQAGHGGCAARVGLARTGCSILRCRRAAPAAARSSPKSTVSAPIAGRQSNSSAMAAARPADCRSRRPSDDCGLASPAAADRADPRRGRLWRSVAQPRDPAQIWPQGRDRADDGALHGAAGRRRGDGCWCRCRCIARGCGARLQPVGAGRARTVAPAWHRAITRPLSAPDERRRSRA